jgi:hypothetical protein
MGREIEYRHGKGWYLFRWIRNGNLCTCLKFFLINFLDEINGPGTWTASLVVSFELETVGLDLES